MAKLKLGVDLKGFKAGMVVAGRELDKFKRKSRKTVAANQKGFSSLKKSALGLATAFGALSAALTVATITKGIISIGSEFEKMMAVVKSVSRATQSEFEAMNATVRDLGATTEFTATQAAEGLKFLTMAGIEANEALAALPGTLDLATAGQLGLGEAADIASNAMTAMGMSADELNRINDSFINTTTRSNSTVQMLAESFKYVAPTARALGYDIEQTNAMLGRLHDAGIQGSMAGTQLNQALLRANKTMAKMGMEGDLLDLLRKIKEEQWSVNEVMSEFAGRGGRAILVLKELIPEIEDLEQAQRDNADAATDMADAYRDTTIGAFDELKSAIQGIAIDVFTEDAGDLKDAIQNLTETIRSNKTEIAAFGEFLLSSANAMVNLVAIMGKYSKLRSIWGTSSQAADLADQGKLGMKMNEFLEKGFLERQRIVDAIIADEERLGAAEKARIGESGAILSMALARKRTDFENTYAAMGEDVTDFIDNLLDEANSIEKTTNSVELTGDALEESKKDMKDIADEAERNAEAWEKAKKETEAWVRALGGTGIFSKGFEPGGQRMSSINQPNAYQVAYDRQIADIMKMPVIGDDYSGTDLIEDFDEPVNEIADLIEDTFSRAAAAGIEDGFDGVKQVIASTVAVAVQKGVSDMVSTAIHPIAGAIAGPIAGALAFKAISNSPYGGGPSEGEIIREQQQRNIKELKKNTEALDRTTQALKNVFSSFSSDIFNMTESFRLTFESIKEDFSDIVLTIVPGGGSFTEQMYDIFEQLIDPTSPLSLKSEMLNMEDYGLTSLENFITKVTENIPDALDAVDFAAFVSNVDSFRVAFDKLHEDIMDSAAGLAEAAGDSFRTAGEIQKREFGKTATDILLGMVQLFESDSVYVQGVTKFAKTLVDMGASWEDLGDVMLATLIPGTQEYIDAQKVVHDLQMANSLELADIARTMMEPFKSLVNSIDDFNYGQKTKDYTVEDWQEEIFDLNDQIKSLDDTTSSYNDDALDLMNKQFAATQTLVSLAENQLNAYLDAQQSIEQQIWEMSGGGGSQYTSTALWQERYSALLSTAQTSGDVSDVKAFQDFIDPYMSTLMTAGFSGDQLRSQAIADLSGLSAGMNIPINDLRTLADTEVTAVKEPLYISININIDGEEIGYAVSKQIESGNAVLIESIDSRIEEKLS